MAQTYAELIFVSHPPPPFLLPPVDTGAKLPGRGGEGACGVCLRAFVCVCVCWG